MTPVSKYQALQHYRWGLDCEAWNLLDQPSLGIKQERMPPGSAEQLHYHEMAQQFFYILKGEALFEIDENLVTVREGEGLHIKAGENHRLRNPGTEDLEFIICSQPTIGNDRINLP